MQSQQNNIVKDQLMKQVKQFHSKQTMIPFYMSYDFPDKQRPVKSFWEDLIEKTIKIKKQIYITFRDLQAITTIQNLKPLPIKKILVQLKKDSVYVREQDITQDRKIQKKVKPWYTSIMQFAWAKPSPPEFQWPFTFQPQQKIVSWKVKQRKKRQLLLYLQSQFAHDNSRLMRDLVRQISLQIKVDQVSVDLILKELVRLKEIYIGEVENVGDSVIIYNSDRKKVMDENFVRVEKIKCMLQGQLHRLGVLYDKSSDTISNLRTKAKSALLQQDKKKAKVLIAQAVTQQKHREQINVRIQVFQQRISQIQLNQMNKSSIDLMHQAQKVYEDISVDSQQFDKVMQKERQQQAQSQQANMKFQDLAASQDIDDEVDKMLKEIEKDSEQKGVEQKRVFVNLPSQKKDVQIDRQRLMFN